MSFWHILGRLGFWLIEISGKNNLMKLQYGIGVTRAVRDPCADTGAHQPKGRPFQTTRKTPGPKGVAYFTKSHGCLPTWSYATYWQYPIQDPIPHFQSSSQKNYNLRMDEIGRHTNTNYLEDTLLF